MKRNKNKTNQKPNLGTVDPAQCTSRCRQWGPMSQWPHVIERGKLGPVIDRPLLIDGEATGGEVTTVALPMATRT
jgi:hypothetical protein